MQKKLEKKKFLRLYLNHCPLHCCHTLAEVFYYVNYVNVNYSVKNSTVDCKYLLFLQDFFLWIETKTVQKKIWKLIRNTVNIYSQQLNF